MRRRNPLVVFADDYGRHPSSCQHLIRRMLVDRDVLWVNTIGTRRPRFCRADASRALGRLWRMWYRPAGSQFGPKVIAPTMWPGFARTWQRQANRWLVGRAVSRAIKRCFDELPIVITTLPTTADLVGRIPARAWLYYCVDDFAAWPGLDGPTLKDMETDLLHRVDAVAAVSEPLAGRARNAGHEPVMITHGVDAKFWRSPAVGGEPEPIAAAIRAADAPRALFWGLVDERLDQPVVRALARRVGSLWLVGPRQGQVQRMAGLSRVHMPGPVDYQHLPQLAEAADLLVMPYADLPVTRAMQPLKLLEYLATDKPVICSDLPALRCWADACDVSGRHAFVDCAVRRADQGPSASQLHARHRRLVYESWEAKAAEMESALDALIKPQRRGPGRKAA